jgi:hypothetical protein
MDVVHRNGQRRSDRGYRALCVPVLRRGLWALRRQWELHRDRRCLRAGHPAAASAAATTTAASAPAAAAASTSASTPSTSSTAASTSASATPASGPLPRPEGARAAPGGRENEDPPSALLGRHRAPRSRAPLSAGPRREPVAEAAHDQTSELPREAGDRPLERRHRTRKTPRAPVSPAPSSFRAASRAAA